MTTNHQPYTIYFEKYTPEDFVLYNSLVNSEQVMAMITERALTEEEARVQFVELLHNNTLHPDFGRFKVFETETKTYIGLAKIEIQSGILTEAELGYMVVPEYWGKGFGKQIAALLLDIGLKQETLEKVTAIIDPSNVASRKILIHQGFISEKIDIIDDLPTEILSKRLKLLVSEKL
ncbi:GNAT family N-acetyltransferase [Flavobacterium kingsejongi]|uniref:N-acetyltransferase domain-containing protein n=1 Tax=Flavobacterium kingsejongi TaxID=1678728 RepID=A0A2S1LS01_9FLAO|nr:GNAT family N-acetyltransferase [Flavobacterium kingsejongi]AWG26545.1 hypothetical protein FK004_15590 [Flavobacterium kingsejongi]